MKVIRYKRSWSHGTDRNYSYQRIGANTSKEHIKQYIDEIQSEYSYSEHYRGISYDIIDLPIEVSKEWLKETNDEIKMKEEYKLELESYINQLENY